jgi:Zn-dependent peptidase ImmA (M78 family)
MPSENDLLTEIGKYLNFSAGKYIRVVPIDTSNKLILGKLRHFKEGVQIGINEPALNKCWKRFVIVKELSHLLMSKNNEGITQDIEDLVNGLFQMSFGLSDDIDHEHLALLMASEYLMPYRISQDLLKDSSLSSLDIAKQFSVPEVVVKGYRSLEHIEERDEAYKDMYIEHDKI